jgi:hypothetical protein
MSEEIARQIISDAGGKIIEGGQLPDGSGFMIGSFPLPKDHWLTKDQDGYNVPPMPFRMGANEFVGMTTFPCNPGERYIRMTRQEFADRIREAGKYAARCATMNGKDMDFDPDALLQNLVVGMIGYWTDTGLSSDDWANPKPEVD